MEGKFYAIGERFTVGNNVLLVVEDIEGVENNCTHCFFDNTPKKCNDYPCNYEDREDGKDVHFLKVGLIS